MHSERIMIAPTCVAEGAQFLATAEPRFAEELKLSGALPLRWRPDGFAQLLSAIANQQVSVAAANAIWGRMRDARLTGPSKIQWASDKTLHAVGPSRQKIRYAWVLADARINYTPLRDAPSDLVIATLTEVPGIGVWTAEIYAIFSLGRADVFAPGDLALQEASLLVFEIPDRPSERVLRQMAEGWSPWSAVAARLLWAYYKIAKQRDGTR